MTASISQTGLIAVIGGSGFDRYPELESEKTAAQETPYGKAAPLAVGKLQQKPLVFMPRHGEGHRNPPHKINYRANLWALKNAGVSAIVAVHAVGGIRADLAPGTLVLPDQIIDYTYGREHTLYSGNESGVQHIDFNEPFDAKWRATIYEVFKRANLPVVMGGVYGCTQGPRLETAAEIKRLRNDGCDMVGMTAMPEAAIAREMGLAYASLSVVVNWAAGIEDTLITMEAITVQLEKSMADVKTFLRYLASPQAE